MTGNIHEAIATGLAAELKPGPGEHLTAMYSDFLGCWQVVALYDGMRPPHKSNRFWVASLHGGEVLYDRIDRVELSDPRLTSILQSSLDHAYRGQR